MAKKETCPTCGKRNRVGERRCIVCAALLNPETPEVPRGLSVGPQGGDAPRPGGPPIVESAPAGTPPPLGEDEPGPSGPDDRQPQGPFPIPPAEPRDGAEPFDPDDLQLDRPLRAGKAPPPPPLEDHERFDPDGLIIDPPG